MTSLLIGEAPMVSLIGEAPPPPGMSAPLAATPATTTTTATTLATATSSSAAATAPPPGVAVSHHLQTSWTVWEHRRNKGHDAQDQGLEELNADASYLAGIRAICKFSTVEEFWQAFAYLPLPSKFFFDGRTRHDFTDRSVEGFSIFREGVRPMWEDKRNNDGGEWYFRGFLPLGDLDAYWEESILGLIGETLDPSDELCGLRIIDKSRVHSGKAHIRPAYRLELWFKTSTDHALREEIKKRWTNCLKDGMVARGRKPSALKLDYRDHA
jgi:translation initiation factor 4E